jgi:phospholipase C
VILGPRARRGHVSHLQFDPNSVINLIRWRHGLDPVGDSPRNFTSLNMAHALDFAAPPTLAAPDFGVPAGRGGIPEVPFGTLCDTLPVPAGANAQAAAKSRAEHLGEWNALRDMCRRHGLI